MPPVRWEELAPLARQDQLAQREAQEEWEPLAKLVSLTPVLLAEALILYFKRIKIILIAVDVF